MGVSATDALPTRGESNLFIYLMFFGGRERSMKGKRWSEGRRRAQAD